MSDSIVVNGLPSIIMPNPSFFSFGNGGGIKYGFNTELITIPVGSGLDPYVLSASYMVPIRSCVLATLAYVVTAPGGGASNFTAYTNPGGDNIGTSSTVTVGAKAEFFDWDDAVSNYYPATTAAQKIELRTNADVTVSDMVVRIGVYWMQMVSFTS
jgi:hypothetical protein